MITGTEVLQHVRNAACAESDGFNAASIDVAFVDDGRIQVASHIDRTSRDQVKAPRHSAENRQRAGFLQLRRINVVHFCFGGVVKNLGQIRTGTTLLINRSVQFVNDNAGNIGVFCTAIKPRLD